MPKKRSIDSVLDRLGELGCGPRKTGDRQWEAKCPAHKDTNPSLSIGMGDDGKVLLRCHAGCEFEDVLRKLDLKNARLDGIPAEAKKHGRRGSPDQQDFEAQLEFAQNMACDEWFEPWAKRLGLPVSVFSRYGCGANGSKLVCPEHDAEGNVIGLLERTEAGKKKTRPGSKRGLYLPADDPEPGTWLIICEAASDTLKVASLYSLDEAVCVIGLPQKGGALDLASAYANRVQAADVVIAADADDTNPKIAARLQAEGFAVRVIHPPAPAKDFRDWLNGPGNKREFLNLIEAAPPPPRVVDLSNCLVVAQQFRREHPHLLRYQQEFYRFDGRRYEVLEKEGLRQRIYVFLNTAVTPDYEPQPVRPHAVSAVEDALRADAYLEPKHEPPCWLAEDEPREAAEFLNCGNGLLHLPTGELCDHTPHFFSTHGVDYEYDAAAAPPERFEEFLRELWPDHQDQRWALQEVAGYLLTPDTSQQKAFLIIGPKRSGKGTLLRVFAALVGPHNVAAPTLDSLGGEFGLQSLVRRTVATMTDVRVGGSNTRAVQTLLAVTGEDYVTVNRKHIDPLASVRLQVRFVLCANEVPRLQDSSGAMASRFIVFQLRKSFFGREDPQLTDKLLGELPGILNWAIEGYRRLRDRGYFEQPASSAEVVHQLEDLGSPVGTFVRETCVVGLDHRVSCAGLFGAWKRWAQDNGHHPGSSNTFGKSLRAVVPEVQTADARSGVGRRDYVGVGLAVGKPGRWPQSAPAEPPQKKRLAGVRRKKKKASKTRPKGGSP